MYDVNIYTGLGQWELPDYVHAKMNPMSCDFGPKNRAAYEHFLELLYVSKISQSHLQGQLRHLGQIPYHY